MAASAKDSKLLEQKDLISQLNTIIAAQTELIQSLKKDHEADREQIQNLLAQVDYLTKKLFGASSEKMKDVEGQLNLFDEAEQETEVVNIYRETYKCPVCSTANAMAENIKFANAMPLYRQEQDWHQLGVDFTRATLANWIIYCADNYFQPVYDHLHRQLLQRKYLMADETRIQVLNEPERNPETDSFMWLFRLGKDGLPPIILYHYTETRAGYNAVDFLDGFSDGYLETDGYQGYNNLPGIKRCSCWAHTRRYFIDAFWSWLDEQKPRKGSRFETAVKYAQNRKDTLMTYLEDGHCSLSNNLSENAIRPFTVGRKNWLFSATPKGASVN